MGCDSVMEIKDDAHYERALKWLTEKAEKLEQLNKEIKHPLISKEKKTKLQTERDKLNKNYDEVAEALKRYSHPEMFDLHDSITKTLEEVGEKALLSKTAHTVSIDDSHKNVRQPTMDDIIHEQKKKANVSDYL